VRYEYVDVTDRADLVSPYPEVVGALERLGWRTLGRCATEFPPRVTERLLAGYAEPARSEFAAHVPDVATVQLSADGTTFAFVSWFWGSPPDAHRAHVAELAATPVPHVRRGRRGAFPEGRSTPDVQDPARTSQDPGSGPEGWTRAERPAYGERVRAVSLLLLCRDEA
jgi:hypothetical protein